MNKYIKLYEQFNIQDIVINVDNKNYLIDKLIEKFTLIIKKRKIKTVRIISINGYIDKMEFNYSGSNYKTLLDIKTSNNDNITGELKKFNIIIKINDNIIYDIIDQKFDNEILIDKIINKYYSHLKDEKFYIKN